MVVLLVVGAGIAVAGLVALAARRWPVIQAPKVQPDTITEGVQEHPKFADHFRKRFDPKTETGVALTIATAAVIAATVGIGVVVAMIRTHSGLAALDLSFARYGARHASHSTTTVLRDISRLGSTPVVIGLGLVVIIVELIRGRSRAAALALFVALVILGQWGLSNGIKFLVARARPNIDQLTTSVGTSFPSGHTTAAAATYAALALVLTRARPRSVKIAAAAIAAGIAAMVASTRVLLGVHWLTDVIAGLFLGWGWFAICSIAFGGRLLTFGHPVAAAEQVATVTPPAEDPEMHSATMGG